MARAWTWVLLVVLVVAGVVAVVMMSPAPPAEDQAVDTPGQPGGQTPVRNAVAPRQPGTSLDAAAGSTPGEGVDVADLPTLALDIEQKLRDDPKADGWDTEATNSRIGKRLKALQKVLDSAEPWTAEQLQPYLAEQVVLVGVTNPMAEAYRDPAVTVRREAPDTEPVTVRGNAAAVARTLNAWRDTLGEISHPHSYFKLYYVDVTDEQLRTRQYLAYWADTPQGMTEWHADWTITWTDDDRIAGIEASDAQHILATTGKEGQTLFAECTEAVLAGNASWHDQLRFGVPHWLPRLEVMLGFDSTGHHGVAVGDVNNDGLEDVYICQGGGLPNRLFVQQADGSALDVSREAGVDVMDLTRSALLIDIDNDGDQDLVLTQEYGLLLLDNDGTGKFTYRDQVRFEGQATSIVAADYDTDGDLDIYVCVYHESLRSGMRDFGNPMPYHDANNGGRNILLRNNGDWTFTDVTAEVGLDENNTRWSFAAGWEDYDNDGHVDLYVANDFGRNNLYRNNGDGTFSDVAAAAGVEDISAGMSVTWADANHDGWMDLYVGNMFSSAGNRITYQRQFKPGVDEATVAQFRRHARGNSLFINNGDGTFRDASVEAGVTMGRWAWATDFVDINNDGFEDIIVTNGYLTNALADDL